MLKFDKWRVHKNIQSKVLHNVEIDSDTYTQHAILKMWVSLSQCFKSLTTVYLKQPYGAILRKIYLGIEFYFICP